MRSPIDRASHTRRVRRVAEAEVRHKRSRDGSRDESKAPAKTETRLEKETQRERENTRNDSQMLELVRRALLYRKSATAAVVLHVESNLHEHANGRRKRCTSSVSSAHSSRSRALTNKAHAPYA